MDVVSPILAKAAARYVINKLIDAATTYLRDQYYWKTDLQEELQSIQDLLPHIQSVIGFVENRIILDEASNPALIKWLWQFKDGIEEAEEVLDELDYLELKKKVNSDKSRLSRTVDASVKTAKILLKFDDVLGRLRRCVKNLNKSASNVEKFLALVPQTGGISSGQMQQEILPLSHPSRITSSLPRLSFKGRNEEKDRIIQYLLGESVEESEIQNSDNVHCLPLVALGGMGKTALAQQVFDHFVNVKKEHFDIKIWVCDSLPVLNAFSLMKKILDGSESEPLERLPVKLKEKLHSKRFLLVLDDAWDDKNQKEWEKLCDPLKFGQNGSWILLTTRLESVAKMISKEIRGTMKPMMLQGLSKDECLSLLYEHAFAGQDLNIFSQLQEIGKEIVEKLNGVPLLAKSIGGALNSKLEADYWWSISKSELWTMPQDLDRYEFIPALTLSYKMLPPCLKRCFSYCGIFPQDYQFNKQKIVCMWVAAGLIYSEGSEEDSDEHIANRWFDMLCNKSFFDVRTYNQSTFRKSIATYDLERDYYTMHDMLNGLARHVSRYECCRIVDGTPNRILDYNAIRHLSIANCTGGQLYDLAKIVCKFKHLRTIWIKYNGNSQRLADFIRDACKSPRRIRVLIIKSYISGVRDLYLKSISDFVKIRFLEIPSGFLPSLSMRKLYFLQVLIGDGYHNSSLAKDANKLTNLRHLYEVPTFELLSVAKVGKLTSLQELCFAVGTKPGYRIDELMNMANLHQLSIKQLSNVQSLEEVNKVNLVSKSSLTRLGLGWNWKAKNINSANSNSDLDQQKVLAALKPPPTIRQLCFENYEGARLASWMDTLSLSRLENLQLDYCASLEELPPLWKLPCLKFLKLNQMKARSLGCDSSDQMDIQFPALEELEFGDLPLWEEWNGADDCTWFPHLKCFEIVNCPKLKKIPNLPMSIEVLWMENLGLEALPRSYKCSNGSKTIGGFQQLTSLELLRISKCSEIVLGEEHDQLLPSSLKELELENIDEHKYLASYLRGLTLLTRLNLRSFPGLESLPLASGLEHLTALQKLAIYDSEALISPGGLYIIKSLKSLSIYNCPKFLFADVESQEFLEGKTRDHEVSSSSASNEAASILPSSLESLNFNKLDISQESLGRCLQGLASLKKLVVSGCHHLVSLPNIEYLHNLTALQTLGISDCKELCELESLTALVSLRELDVSYCHHLVSLPFLHNLTALQTLLISNCEELCELESLTTFVSLRKLDVSYCHHLVSLPFLHNLTTLQVLSIRNCKELCELESLTALVSLRELSIKGCPKLLATTFSILQDPATITEQSATKIKKETLPSLEGIYIDDIFYLLLLPISKSLKSITIVEKEENVPVPLEFTCFPSEMEEWLLQCRESLENLYLGNMPHLQSLPASLENFSSLKYLTIPFAPELKSLPRMPASLERLRISGCSGKLKKRCQENIGRDWPNINHIGYIIIEEGKAEAQVNCNWISSKLWSAT